MGRILTGLLFAAILATSTLLIIWNPLRVHEAGLFLLDVAAGYGPSDLKVRTPDPKFQTIQYAVEGRNRLGDLYTPGNEVRAGLVLVPGLTPQGKDDRVLIAFARTLARVGFLVLVPEIEGLRRLEVGPGDARIVADAARHLDERLDADTPTGLVAVSFAAGPTLAALLEPGMEGRIDFVVSIGGYWDLEAALTFATTGFYRDGPEGTWKKRAPNDYGKWVFLRSNTDNLESPQDRVLLRAIGGRKLNRPEADVSDLTKDLGSEGLAIYALITNRNPEQVGSLVASLPDAVRADMARLDPRQLRLERTETRFVLIHGRDDPFIPETESKAFARALDDRAELFLAEGLTHVVMEPAGWTDRLTLLRAAYRILELRDGG